MILVTKRNSFFYAISMFKLGHLYTFKVYVFVRLWPSTVNRFSRP